MSATSILYRLTKISVWLANIAAIIMFFLTFSEIGLIALLYACLCLSVSFLFNLIANSIDEILKLNSRIEKLEKEKE